jgi:hypothetical protein
MILGRAAIATTFLIGCTVPLAVPAATAAAATSGGGHSLCAPPDDTVAPVISEVAFGEPTIDLNSGSRAQTITVTASDTSGTGDPSGVDRLVLLIRGNDFFSQPKLELTSGTPASGEWTGRFVVSKYAHPGTSSIQEIFVIDADGNEQVYPGYGNVPQSPNALSLHPEDDPTFTVTGTPADRPPREPAGDLDSFSFDPTSVDTKSAAQHVRVVARFTGAAPTRVSVQFYNPKRNKHTRFVYLQTELKLQHGIWSGSLRVARWLGDQTVQAYLFASYGRNFRPSSRRYEPQDLHRLNLPYKLGVVSGVDTTHPALTSLTLSPSSIDSTAGPEQVTVTATATDTRSGVHSIDVSGGIHHGVNGVAGGFYPLAGSGIGYLSAENFHVRLKKTAGGDWVGVTTVKKCVPSGTYKLDVRLADAADNYRSYGTKQLAHAGITSTVDVTSEHGDIAKPYVYSAATLDAQSWLILNFSEGVANVSTSTLTVYPLSPKSTLFTTPSTVTDLTCYNGSPAPVDCSGSGGLVTSAVLTVPSLEAGKKYQVYANQDQITDQLVDGNRNPMQWNSRATEVIGA